ncbi:peroxidasin-like isoform X1 [Montipora foliosa]|uniref:peroxidasin-like isoform X1 n=1 Tax=Montipora foliosa TaxID=591990 RepID=UPI0035F1333F
MPELLRKMCKRRIELSNMKAVYTLFYLIQSFVLLEGFQWSFRQQANHVISVEVGSEVSLPCEYELTPQEQQEANIFHLLTWTREEPVNSEQWAGLAIKSTLTGSKVIYDNPQRIFITNGTLTVRNVTVKDWTRYQCAFQSSFFTTPSVINLDIKHPPAITLQPLSQEVTEGNGTSLLCSASGNPQPKITWTKLGSSAVLSSSNTLTLTNLSSEDDGAVYTCTVENYLGSTQASATITMLYPPAITLQPLSQEVTEGNGTSLLCSASGNPQPKITWTKLGSSAVLPSSNTLTLTNLSSEDDGAVYTCTVENYLGSTQASATITMLYPPAITLQPLSQEVTEGNGISLLCSASGNPQPKITWTKLGSSAVLSSSNTLTLTNLSSEDDGAVYTCTVENYLGSTQASATITMLYQPKDTEVTIPSGEMKEGERLDITCRARANPSPEYKFYHNGKLITHTSKGLYSLASVTTKDEGTYRCVPLNRLGVGPEAFVTVTIATVEAFPIWAYLAIGGGVLFVVLIATVVILCRGRRSKKAQDDKTKSTQPESFEKSRPVDAKEAHIGPGAFYGDFNGSTEIPYLNGAVSFSDIRVSREFPSLKGSLSANDVRMGELPDVKAAMSENNLRMGEIPSVKGALSDNNVKISEFQTAFSKLEEAYPTNSVIHLITGAEEAVSQL